MSQAFEPTDELLLAQALDACIRAERDRPGAADELIARAPAGSRDELARLVAVVRALDAAAADVRPSAEFRAAARERLMQRIVGEQQVADGRPGTPLALTRLSGSVRSPARVRWLLRTGGGLLAAALAGTATLTASASSLPGDPLYPVKQVQEEITLRLAPNDEARALTLLRRADSRLDETTRLVMQGRASEAALTAQRYDETVERATSTFLAAVNPADPADAELVDSFEAKLQEHQLRLEAVLSQAPEPAQAGLLQALEASEHGQEVAASPRGLGRAPDRSDDVPPAVVAGAPEPEPEPIVTEEPARPAIATSAPAPRAVVAVRRDQRTHEDEAAVGRAQARGDVEAEGGPDDNAQARSADDHGQGGPDEHGAVRSEEGGEHRGRSDEGRRGQAPAAPPPAQRRAPAQEKHTNEAVGAIAPPAPAEQDSDGGRGEHDGRPSAGRESDDGGGTPSGPGVQPQPVKREAQQPQRAQPSGGDGDGHGGGTPERRDDQRVVAPPTTSTNRPVAPQPQPEQRDDSRGRVSSTTANRAPAVVTSKPTPTPAPRRSGDGSGGDGGDGSRSPSVSTTTSPSSGNRDGGGSGSGDHGGD